MSIIKAIKHVLGMSATPANNFVLDASADNGTMKLARESGQDIMTVAADGSVAFPANPALPAFKGTNTPTVFSNKAATPFAGFQATFPSGTVPGWNPTTGEYTIQKTGWYSLSFWMSCGQFAAWNINPYFQVFGTTAWSSFAGIYASSGPSAFGYLSTQLSALQYFTAGQKVRVMAVVEWGDAGSHPLTDGAAVFSVAYLHP